MNKYRFKFAAGWIFLVTILYRLMLPAAVMAEPFEKVLDRLRNNIAPLDLGSQPRPSPDAVSYFQYYGIDYKDAAHYFGYFEFLCTFFFTLTALDALAPAVILLFHDTHVLVHAARVLLQSVL